MAHIDISILGQQYKISCPEGEELTLQNSVDQFNEKIRNIKSSARTLRNEQVIVLAALNLCHELNVEKTQHQEQTKELDQRIQKINESMNQVLTKDSK
ncbi:MAG: cell division protein ZapA [Psychromonas sp.]|jgi:cell division protein ZapA|uniref:cell division protein ZapA n=1 Tax=Psychromonas sp. TaxID=1884585 RepID=UPI0039E63C2D